MKRQTQRRDERCRTSLVVPVENLVALKTIATRERTNVNAIVARLIADFLRGRAKRTAA